MKLKPLLIYLPILTLSLLLSFIQNAEAQPGERQLLHNLLDEFLEGASVNDYDTHNRFWADDLVYTGSGGDRITKSDILDGLTKPSDADKLPLYNAEEVDIRLYGDTAVVAFKLVAEVPAGRSGTEIMEFYNTGTFLKRDGEWRAVAWQATRIPG